jgi:hypothetical protein
LKRSPANEQTCSGARAFGATSASAGIGCSTFASPPVSFGSTKK